MPVPRFHQVLVSPRIGGGEKLALEIHRYTTARWPGSSRLLAPANGDTEKLAVAEHLDFRSYRLDWLEKKGWLYTVLGNASFMSKLLRADGLLHIHSPYVYRALLPYLRATRLEVVLHLHLDYPRADLEWCLKLPPDLVITCAAFMKELVSEILARQGAGSVPVIPVINAVDVQKFAPGDRAAARQSMGVATDDMVLLMTANLAAHKGQETAIRAVRQLKERGLAARLWLVGEERDAAGSYLRRLRELTASLGLDDAVSFLGFRDDVAKLLHAADALLLPSTQEGLPLALLEAQASKVVVLAAPTAGIPEIIEHGRTGFLIAAHDADAYARTLSQLHDDAALARRVADAAYAQVMAKFTMSRYCDQVLAAYGHVMRNAS
jgi:glycosyltransferase involved in cell wall biosynthesis